MRPFILLSLLVVVGLSVGCDQASEKQADKVRNRKYEVSALFTYVERANLKNSPGNKLTHFGKDELDQRTDLLTSQLVWKIMRDSLHVEESEIQDFKIHFKVELDNETGLLRSTYLCNDDTQGKDLMSQWLETIKLLESIMIAERTAPALNKIELAIEELQKELEQAEKQTDFNDKEQMKEWANKRLQMMDLNTKRMSLLINVKTVSPSMIILEKPEAKRL